MSKVLVAMSGGVDSSVCALELAEAGHEVVGATMRLLAPGRFGVVGQSTCCSLEDVQGARLTCDKLGIRHVTFDLDDEFAEHVMAPFSDAYAAGLTPNPCILCNRHLKFDLLWRLGQQLGCDALATGHYARVVRPEGQPAELHRARAADKDQSYVLYPVRQEVLAHLMLPLGEFASKEEVRERAEAAGLSSAHKHDSQDICFVPDGDYPAFLERFRGRALRHGQIVDEQGQVLGEHEGIERFTIGQRKGIGISGPGRLYVLSKEPQTARVVVGENERLGSNQIWVADANWLAGAAPEGAFRGQAVVCHHGIVHEVTVSPEGEGRFMAQSDAPIRAVAPGQSMVVYDGDRVVCGGVIERAGMTAS